MIWTTPSRAWRSTLAAVRTTLVGVSALRAFQVPSKQKTIRFMSPAPCRPACGITEARAKREPARSRIFLAGPACRLTRGPVRRHLRCLAATPDRAGARAGPALESAGESGRVGEADQIGRLVDRNLARGQIVEGEAVAEIVDEL